MGSTRPHATFQHRATLFVLSLLLASCDSPRSAEPVSIELSSWILRAGNDSVFVTLPDHFNHRGGRISDQRTVYTLTASVGLPSVLVGRPLDLVIPYLAANVRASVDGVAATAVHSEPTSIYRTRGPHVFRLPPSSSATRELELDIEHTWTQSAWFDTVPRIVPAGARDRTVVAVELVNNLGSTVALIGLLQIAGTYLAMFLWDRARRAYLWFALAGAIAAYYPAFVLGLTQSVFGRLDAAVLVLALGTAPILSVYFNHAQLGLEAPGSWWLGILGIIVVVAFLAHDPFAATNYGMQLSVITVFLVVCYQLSLCLRMLIRRPRPRAVLLILACWAMLALTGWNDCIALLGWGEPLSGVRLACPGLAFFALIQSLILSREHIHTLSQTDELNAKLGERVAMLEVRQGEIQQLNDELRRQIAERSTQLLAALSLSDRRSTTSGAVVPGTVIANRYRVVREIGAGGMAQVYEVERTTDSKHFALKLTRELDPSALARLAREALIVAQIAHPNVVTISDVNVTTDGHAYLIIELVDGPSLRNCLSRFGDVVWALPIVHQLARALEALHEIGVYHRDLKPANILLTGDVDRPTVKLADFGISRVARPENITTAKAQVPNMHVPTPRLDTPVIGALGQALTPPLGIRRTFDEPGAFTDFATPAAPVKVLKREVEPEPFEDPSQAVVGTPRYMAPESALDPNSISDKADVFSFGVVAYELLARNRPFKKPPAAAIQALEPVPEPTSLVTLCPSLDPELSRLLDRCLNLDPFMRPKMAAIVRALDMASQPRVTALKKIT